MTVFSIPIQVISEANERCHWRARYTRSKKHRRAAYVATRMHASQYIQTKRHITVTMTRHAKRRMDSDNIASAFKATRDGIAEALEIDDGDPIVEWKCEQVIGPVPMVSVRIEMSDMSEAREQIEAVAHWIYSSLDGRKRRTGALRIDEPSWEIVGLIAEAARNRCAIFYPPWWNDEDGVWMSRLSVYPHEQRSVFHGYHHDSPAQAAIIAVSKWLKARKEDKADE